MTLWPDWRRALMLPDRASAIRPLRVRRSLRERREELDGGHARRGRVKPQFLTTDDPVQFALNPRVDAVVEITVSVGETMPGDQGGPGVSGHGVGPPRTGHRG